MDFGPIPSFPPFPSFSTTAAGDRDPGKNHYFLSRKPSRLPQAENEGENKGKGTEESDHHIDIRI